MPKYDYKCTDCETIHTQSHSMIDLPEPSPCCEAPVKKVYHTPAIAFKGDGWGGTKPKP